jgi:hypothetical protein
LTNLDGIDLCDGIFADEKETVHCMCLVVVDTFVDDTQHYSIWSRLEQQQQ